MMAGKIGWTFAAALLLATPALAQTAPAQSTEVRRSPFIQDCAPKVAADLCRAPLAFLYEEADRRLGTASLVYWTDGKTLNIAARSPTAHAELTGTIQEGLAPMSTTGSLWGASYAMPQLEKSLIEMRLGETGPTLVYRGPQAPAAPPSNAVLKGKVETVEIKSAALQAARTVTVYVPPGAAPKTGWPAVIVADAEGIDAYIAIVDALIEQKLIQPVAVVAVQAKAGGGEYLRGKDPDAYVRHTMFIDREVMPIAVGRFSVTKDPGKRLLFGTGDGGDWAVQTAIRDPLMAHNVAAFSVTGASEPPFRAGKMRLFMRAGAYEGPYLRGSRSICSVAAASGTPCRLEVAYAGHAPLIWQAQLGSVLQTAFPPAKAPSRAHK